MQSQCTCPHTISSRSELCLSCEREYENWLADQQAEAELEVRFMSSTELFGLLMEAELELCLPAAAATRKAVSRMLHSGTEAA